MRHTVMLQLEIGRVPHKPFIDQELIYHTAAKLARTSWPIDALYDVGKDAEYVHNPDDE